MKKNVQQDLKESKSIQSKSFTRAIEITGETIGDKDK